MLRAYKYELEPTSEQKQQLNGAFGSCRAVYNLALETKNRAYQAGKNLTCFDLMKQLPDLKEEFVWLKDVPSQSLQQAISNLDNAFTNFFKGRASFPKFKKKDAKQSFRIPISVRVNFETNCVRLPKCGDVKFYNSREFEGEVKQATVSKTTTGRYFISILVEDKKELPIKKEIKESTTIGIDLGLKHFAILSDGTKIENPKFLVKAQKELKVQQRSLSRKKKGSKRREKQKLVVAKLYEKITNQRKDFLHKLSTQIVNEYDSVAIENLNVSGMIKNKNLAKHIEDVSWGTFESYLKYKADWYGKNILQIGRFEPSSKMCSCGKVNNQLKLSQREWVCVSCGTLHDRDILAANNIKKFGLGQTQTNVKVKH
jgi:putative transposase